MEAVLAGLQSFLGGPVGALTALIFAASVLAVFGVAALLSRDTVGQRMARAGKGDAGKLDVTLRYDLREPGSPVFARIRKAFEPQDRSARSALRRQLVRAGYMHPHAVATYYAFRLLLAVWLPVGILLLLAVVASHLAPNVLFLIALALAGIGFYLPYLYIRVRIDDRQQKARLGFPDALDMLLVCVEAGLGLAAALDRVAKEIGRSHPILAEQFAIVGLEMRAGTSRADALRNFADRIGVDEINAFTTLLVQSEALGTSIADSLRVYAQEMRIKRLVKAEERANKLPVKIAIPLGLAILPCLILVIMTPIIIRFVRVLNPVLGSG